MRAHEYPGLVNFVIKRNRLCLCVCVCAHVDCVRLAYLWTFSHENCFAGNARTMVHDPSVPGLRKPTHVRWSAYRPANQHDDVRWQLGGPTVDGRHVFGPVFIQSVPIAEIYI